ncbi:MAG: adenylate/guanylate cyclase domain-containing protein [Fimbriimonadales bacterium]
MRETDGQGDRLKFEEQSKQLDATLSRELQGIHLESEESSKWRDISELALDLRAEEESRARTGWGRFVRQIKQMDFATRRVVAGAALGLWTGLIAALAAKYGDQYGLASMGQIILVVAAILNCAVCRKGELGALTGGAWAVARLLGFGLCSMVLRSSVQQTGSEIIPYALIAAASGFIFGSVGDRIMKVRFQHDPQKRREYLLKQLIELQEELRKGEQDVTFLSVDVVGSTDMKRHADHLDVEYTFNEYTHFVTAAARSFDGSLHSTAGDGILLTFSTPKDAFLSARKILGGLLEFNTYKNRLGRPFEVRCGIHTGKVNAPTGDAGSVNYSHVIDVTAHVQKVAPPGGIALSDSAAQRLPSGTATFTTSETEVKGVRALLWAGRAPQAEPAPQLSLQEPPPLPPGFRA